MVMVFFIFPTYAPTPPSVFFKKLSLYYYHPNGLDNITILIFIFIIVVCQPFLPWWERQTVGEQMAREITVELIRYD